MRYSLPEVLRPAAAGVCVVLAAACGGSSFKQTSPSTASTTTTVESAESKAWVAAAVQGLTHDPSAPLSQTDATCISHALVDTVTVARLKASGATLAQLSDPNENLPPGLEASVPAAVQVELGKAMQACDFGRLIGAVFTDSIAKSINGGYRVTAKENDCVAAWFDAEAQRQLVADVILSAGPSATDSRGLARLVTQCLDFAAMIAPEMGLTLSAAERSCIDVAARTDESLITALANEIQGTGTDSSASYEHFGARTVKCLTPEHIVQLGKAKR